MSFFHPRLILSMVIGILTIGFMNAVESENPASSQDLVAYHLEKASEALQNQNQDAAIQELLKAIKNQQEIIDKLQSAQTQTRQSSMGTYAPSTVSLVDNPDLLEQLRQSLPLIGGGYTDVEEQWNKAYGLQHKAVFDLSRKEAIPVFEEAVKEYRKLIQLYPGSKRASQSQRQIAWIYQTQLKDNEQAKREWSKLLELFPNSPYEKEAKKALSDLG